MDGLSPDQFYEKYSKPDPEPIIPLYNQPLGKGVPSHAVVPVWLGQRGQRLPLSEATILLTDFGESYLPSDTSRYHSNTLRWFRPPEVHFLPKEPLSFPADIWSLACAIWQIVCVQPLFDAWFATTDNIIREQVDMFGKSTFA